MLSYDCLQYEQYKSVLESGAVSLDALRRIIAHDHSHDANDAGAAARTLVLREAEAGLIPAKAEDEAGDRLYGVRCPVPLQFSAVAEN